MSSRGGRRLRDVVVGGSAVDDLGELSLEAEVLPPAGEYMDRQISEGRTVRKALRGLRRHLIRVIDWLLAAAGFSDAQPCIPPQRLGRTTTYERYRVLSSGRWWARTTPVGDRKLQQVHEQLALLYSVVQHVRCVCATRGINSDGIWRLLDAVKEKLRLAPMSRAPRCRCSCHGRRASHRGTSRSTKCRNSQSKATG